MPGMVALAGLVFLAARNQAADASSSATKNIPLSSVPALVVPFEVRGWGVGAAYLGTGYFQGQIVNSPLLVTNSLRLGANGYEFSVSADGLPPFDGTAAATPVPPAMIHVQAFSEGGHADSALVSVTAADADSARQLMLSVRVVGVACGEFHTVLLHRDGTVSATGWNAAGQTSVPPGLSNVVAVACGLDHSIAVRSDGTALAWGSPRIATEQLVPAAADNFGIIAAAGGARHSLFLREDGRVLAAGDLPRWALQPPRFLTNAVAIAAGAFHNAALTRDGRLVEWGAGLAGADTIAPSFQRIRPAAGVVAIAAGGICTAALHADGSVSVWGDDAYGQTEVPAAATNVVAISVGTHHVLAARADGTVVAWGSAEFGVTSVPAGLTNVVAVAAGGYHSQALLRTGPPLGLPRLRGGRLVAELNLPAGAPYRLDSAPSPGRWNARGDHVATPGAMTLDLGAADAPSAFFRVVTAPRPPLTR